MPDFFITTQKELLSSWRDAFPKAILSVEIPPAPKKQEDIFFWLHMNIDRQQWMINAINNIQKNYPTSRVVVLANAPNQAEAFYAMSIGAQGYCHAYSEGKLLKEVRTVVSHGGIWMGNDLLKQLIEITTSLVGNQPQQVSVLLHQLTKREQDVAIEAAKGLSNKEIARILDITERTVKAHLSSIFETLKAKDRLQLALMLNINHKK
ncbi:MAG TPA: response regulator transcription factor [Methylotenera sp.]|nr:response regulator transcription factor [Methylotenera sp.]